MPDAPAFASTNFEAWRVSLLDSTGNFVTAPLGAYVCDSGISFQNAFINQDGTVYQQRLGNGKFCVNRTGPARQTGATITITICPWQYSLRGLVLGGKVAYDDDGAAIGHSLPDPDELAARNLCVEAWTLAVDGENQGDIDGAPAWHHHIWPQASGWIMGDFTLEDAVTPWSVIGTAAPNNNVGNGPFDDWPDFNDDIYLDGHPTGTYAGYLDTDPPDFLTCQVESFVAPGS